MGAPIPYETVWNGAVPPDGPVSGVDITLGFWFMSDVDGILRGFRHYNRAGDHGIVIGQLWAADEVTLLSSACSTAPVAARVDLVDGWRSVWSHPKVKLVAGTLYLAQVTFNGQSVYRDDGALATTDVVSGHITVPAQNLLGTTGGRYHVPLTFNTPADNPIGNLYAVDVLVEYAP